MKVHSVNVGQPQTIVDGKRSFTTSIFKTPVSGRVRVRTLNIDGDKQADLAVHGGIHKAVYAYPFEHYAAWQAELGRDDFAYGQFGENLTIEGLTEDSVNIGDRYRIGTVIFEVTQPRSPCFKLIYKMGDKLVNKAMLANGRTGFYLRVVEEGEIGAGDAIERIYAEPHALTVHQAHHLMYFDKTNLPEITRALKVTALAPGWHDTFAGYAAELAG